ncbi:MAG TPA: HAD-IA family hydrolase [Candidatus Saccharimonadales bacterium]|nr:HAD-IA family hydrolase [Candidatus Saccharimonadales bacterium]
MLQIAEVHGVIFDVDETLLDTNVHDPVNGLHEQARMQAMHEAGERYNLPALLAITPEENFAHYMSSPVHTMEAVVWNGLQCTGVIPANDPLDPTHELLLEIVARKDVLYEQLLRTKGKAITGALEFIAALAARHIPLAIASTAIRRDIDIFLYELTNLHKYFPDERVVSKESVTHPKPHPEAFDKAFRSLGLPETARSSVLAFEDNPRGIASAKGAGLFTCAITSVQSRERLASEPVPPDLIADSFDAFAQAFGIS